MSHYDPTGATTGAATSGKTIPKSVAKVFTIVLAVVAVALVAVTLRQFWGGLKALGAFTFGAYIAAVGAQILLSKSWVKGLSKTETFTSLLVVYTVIKAYRARTSRQDIWTSVQANTNATDDESKSLLKQTPAIWTSVVLLVGGLAITFFAGLSLASYLLLVLATFWVVCAVLELIATDAWDHGLNIPELIGVITGPFGLLATMWAAGRERLTPQPAN